MRNSLKVSDSYFKANHETISLTSGLHRRKFSPSILLNTKGSQLHTYTSRVEFC